MKFVNFRMVIAIIPRLEEKMELQRMTVDDDDRRTRRAKRAL